MHAPSSDALPPGAALTPGPAIERAKRELEHMIDLHPQGMMLVDGQGHVQRANRALLRLVGAAGFAEVLGRSLVDLFPGIDPTQLLTPGADASEARALSGETPGPDGRPRRLRLTAVGAGAETARYVVLAHDETDAAAPDAHAERRYKQEAVRALMGALMHTVNQPLTVIMIKAHLLHLAMEEGTAHPDDSRRSLQEIMRLTTQVSDLLQTLEQPRDFVTQPYLRDVAILDVDASGEGAAALRESGSAVLDQLLTALDAHHPGEREHARRTAAYAAAIGRRLGWEPDALDTVRRCAAVHDLGKLHVPDAVLQKTAALTEAEWATLRRHAECGYRLLRAFPFLRAEAEAAHAHHEWINGAGYPRGLAGEAIPLMARVVAVAEAFDALCHPRDAGHASRSVEEALAVLRAAAGRQFDAAVVRALEESSQHSEFSIQ